MSRKTDTDILPPEWSVRIDVASLSHGRQQRSIDSTEQQRRDLARRLHVKAIDALKADFDIDNGGAGGAIHVVGRVQGTVVQSCIVTMADVRQPIEEAFDAWYADRNAFVVLASERHERLSRKIDAEVQMLEEREDPEPIIDGRIDLGELAAQYLSLAIEPYPRAEGVAPEDAGKMLQEKGVTEGRRNPFEALKAWKAVRKSEDEHH